MFSDDEKEEEGDVKNETISSIKKTVAREWKSFHSINWATVERHASIRVERNRLKIDGKRKKRTVEHPSAARPIVSHRAAIFLADRVLCRYV